MVVSGGPPAADIDSVSPPLLQEETSELFFLTFHSQLSSGEEGP